MRKLALILAASAALILVGAPTVALADDLTATEAPAWENTPATLSPTSPASPEPTSSQADTGATAAPAVSEPATTYSPAANSPASSSPSTEKVSSTADTAPSTTATTTGTASPAVSECWYSGVWDQRTITVTAHLYDDSGATSCSNPLYVNLAAWTFTTAEKFPQALVGGQPLTVAAPGSYSLTGTLAATCSQIDVYGSFDGPIVLPEVLQGYNEPRMLHDLIKTNAYTYAATSFGAGCVVPPTPPYTPPVLDCPDGTVPGWVNEHGDPTSCVTDEPNPPVVTPPVVIPPVVTPTAETPPAVVPPADTPAPAPAPEVTPAAAAVVAPTSAPESTDDALAFTGADTALPTILVASGLVVAGTVLMLAVTLRRRARS